jgi:hypothetical protein
MVGVRVANADAFLTTGMQFSIRESDRGSGMNRAYFLLAAVVALSACGLAVRMDARNDMVGSKAAYKSCLAQNPGKVSACEASRLSYEADLKAYEATIGVTASSRDP